MPDLSGNRTPMSENPTSAGGGGASGGNAVAAELVVKGIAGDLKGACRGTDVAVVTSQNLRDVLPLDRGKRRGKVASGASRDFGLGEEDMFCVDWSGLRKRRGAVEARAKFAHVAGPGPRLEAFQYCGSRTTDGLAGESPGLVEEVVDQKR